MNEFLNEIVTKDELTGMATAEQFEEINRKLVSRLDVQQGQLDGLQALMGSMQVKITQMQIQIVKMEGLLAAKESEIEMLKNIQNDTHAVIQETQEAIDNKPKNVAPAEESVSEPQEALNEEPQETKAENNPIEDAKTEEPKLAPKVEISSGESKERSASQTIADAIKGEESLADKLSKRVDHETVAASINSSKIDRIQTAITIADRFRFQRELFAGDAVKMAETVETLNRMKNLDEALAYLEKMFEWDSEIPVVKDFIRIVERRF